MPAHPAGLQGGDPDGEGDNAGGGGGEGDSAGGGDGDIVILPTRRGFVEVEPVCLSRTVAFPSL